MRRYGFWVLLLAVLLGGRAWALVDRPDCLDRTAEVL